MADLSIPVTVQPQSNATQAFGTAGESISAGKPVYIDASDSNKIKIADCNQTAAKADCVGIATNTAATGQPVFYQTGGDINLGVTLIRGVPYILSPDQGISPADDLATGGTEYVTLIGIAKSSTLFTVKPFASGVQRA